jgi:hypothetical protein
MPLSFREYLELNEEGDVPVEQNPQPKKVKVVIKRKGKQQGSSLQQIAAEAGVDLKSSGRFGIVKGKAFTWHTKANFDAAMKTLIKNEQLAKQILPKLISGKPLKFSNNKKANEVMFAFYILTKFASKKSAPTQQASPEQQTTESVLYEAALPKNARDLAVNFLNNLGAGNLGTTQYKNILSSSGPVFTKVSKRGPKYAFQPSPKETTGKTIEAPVKTTDEPLPKAAEETPQETKQTKSEPVKAATGTEPQRGEHIKTDPTFKAAMKEIDDIIKVDPNSDFWKFHDSYIDRHYSKNYPPEVVKKLKEDAREVLVRDVIKKRDELEKKIMKYASPEAASYDVKNFVLGLKNKVLPGLAWRIVRNISKGVAKVGYKAKEAIEKASKNPKVQEKVMQAGEKANEFIGKAKQKAEQLAGKVVDATYKANVNMKSVTVGKLLGAEAKQNYLDAAEKLNTSKDPKEQADAQKEIDIINKQLAAKKKAEKETEQINKAKSGKGKPVLTKVPAPQNNEPYKQGELPFESVNYKGISRGYNLSKKIMKNIFG